MVWRPSRIVVVSDHGSECCLMKLKFSCGLLFGLALTAGGAQAAPQPLTGLRTPITLFATPVAATDARPASDSSALTAAVLPNRSIDRRFAPAATGSLGFLCGRQPGQQDYGSAAAFGSDPHGRFLGAKLSLAF
jgi:hypothetical protein